MTIAHLPLMRCDVTRDGEQCDRESISPIGPAPAPELRRYLRTCGWHRTRHGDVCPECWDAGRRPEPTATARPTDTTEPTP